MKKHFLVTGGAGFIGSHLTNWLIEQGHRVRVLDNLSQGRREWINPAAEFLTGDITRLEDCRKAVQGVQGVFHLAAMSKAGPSFELMEFCTEQNVLGTQNVLMASRQAEVHKLIFAASSTYYGNTPGAQTEDLPAQCLNPYALSKQVGEVYCKFFCEVYGLPTLCLRFFNVYGPRQPETGAYALVMGTFLKRAKEGAALEIHGSGEQRRDFVHVSDVVSAIWAGWESPAQGMTLNVGTGTSVSIQELADLISPRQFHAERRKGDADSTLADISATQKHLNWKPRVSLESGLKDLMREMKI